jgi:hypothetical protein
MIRLGRRSFMAAAWQRLTCPMQFRIRHGAVDVKAPAAGRLGHESRRAIP